MATGFTKNFVVKNGITTGPITLDAGTGNITGTNLSVTGLSDLGAVSNITITGGSSGYVLSTDGSGVLSFIDPAAAAQNPAPMPIVIDAGNTLTIGANYQGLFGYPITVNGTLDVEGILIDVNDNGNGGGGGTATSLNASISNVIITGGSSGQYLQTDGTGNLSWAAGGGGGGGSPGGVTTQVQFNDAGSFAGNSGFTFNKTTGTLSAPFFSGAGNALSNIQGANVSGTVANATHATTAGTANSVAGANVSGQVNYAAVANSVAVSNVSGIGNIATVNLTGSSSNVLYGNGVFAAVGASYGNSNVATFLASYGSNTITTTGNVSVGNIIGNGQALTSIAGANVTGTVANATYATSAGTATSATSATTAGTVTTASQPNITSHGTLTGLTVSGITTLGDVGNVKITGGTSGYYLQTDGTGNLSWAAAGGGGSGSPGGSNTQVQFNDAGAFGGNANLLFNKTTGTLTASYFSGSGNALSNIQGANISGTVSSATTAGTVTIADQPNITSTGTLANLKLNGAALSTASAGLFEYDGKVPYFTPSSTQRGVLPGMQYYRLNAGLSRTSDTATYSWLGVGVTLAASTVYAFEGLMVLIKGTNNTFVVNMGFGGTATVNNILYQTHSVYDSGGIPQVDTTVNMAIISTTAMTPITTSASVGAASAFLTGTVSINAGGTFIPQYSLSTAPAGTIVNQAGSYFRIYPIGTAGSNVSVGTWA